MRTEFRACIFRIVLGVRMVLEGIVTEVVLRALRAWKSTRLTHGGTLVTTFLAVNVEWNPCHARGAWRSPPPKLCAERDLDSDPYFMCWASLLVTTKAC